MRRAHARHALPRRLVHDRGGRTADVRHGRAVRGRVVHLRAGEEVDLDTMHIGAHEKAAFVRLHYEAAWMSCI